MNTRNNYSLDYYRSIYRTYITLSKSEDINNFILSKIDFKGEMLLMLRVRCSRENSAGRNFLRPGRKFQTASPSLIFNISQKSPSKIFTKKFHQISLSKIPVEMSISMKRKKRRILMRKAKVMIGKTIIIHGKWQKWHWPIPFNLILWYTVSSLTSDKKFFSRENWSNHFSIKIYGNFFEKFLKREFFSENF